MNYTLKIHALLVCTAMVLTSSTTQAQRIEQTKKVAPGVYEIVFNPQENAVYVAAAGTRSDWHGYIYKLSAENLAILDSIDVQSAPAYGLGFNQTTQTLYTSNTRSNSVHAIDVRTGEVLATIDHGEEESHTRELVVDEEANRIYVSDYGDQGAVWVIDGATNSFSHLIENTGAGSSGLALDAESNRLYVANMTSNEIAVLDLASEQIVETYPAHGEMPMNLALDRAADRLFVANQGSGTATVLNAATGALLATIETGEGALGITYDADRKRIFVANRTAGTVSVIDAETYEVVANLETGTFPNTIALDPDTGVLFVTNKAQSKRGDDASSATPDPNGDTVAKVVQ